MSQANSISIETVKLDELVDSGAIRAPDLIKVDVQGHGGEALNGAAASIRLSLPLIAFSNHSDRERRAARDLLDPLGYTPTDIRHVPIAWDAIGILGEESVALLVPPARKM